MEGRSNTHAAPPGSQYHGKRITIMGLGSFGGGVGAARFFAQHHAHVTVTDLRPAEQLRPALDALADVPVADYHLGGHPEEDFTAADLVVVNPAVPPESPLLDLARRHAVPVTAEINLFFQHCRAPIIGVTGSNGKSTTTALIHHLLQSAWRTHGRRAWLGGNIGRSLLPQVAQIAPGDLVVLELSSFQLETLASIHESPHVAVVTNFTPNHLDRHRTLDAYRDAKQNILRFQTAGDLTVLNFDDPDVTTWATKTPARVIPFSLHAPAPLPDARDLLAIAAAIPLPGAHNRRNALAAATAVRALTGARLDCLRRALAAFRGLPHRLELVREIGGRRFYNDSIATTPESTIAAIQAFDDPLLLIAGGYDKRIDLSPVAQLAARRAKAIALIGQTADALAHATRLAGGPTPPPVHLAEDLQTAVNWAWHHSAPGDVILLSPACASYDQFQNFEHRGQAFRRAVADLAQPVPRASD